MTSSRGLRRLLTLWCLAVAATAALACESDSRVAPTTPSGVLQVTLGTPNLKAGETTTARVSVPGAAGAPMAGITWTSSDATVATVDAAGTVAARRAGRATLTATAGTSVGQATLRVVPDFAGTWTGPIVRAQSSCAATAVIAFCLQSPPPGALLAPITLTLAQTGATVTGTLVDSLEPSLAVTLAGTVADGDVLSLAGASAASPTATRQLSVTNLRATFDPTLGSMTGSYTAAAARIGTAGAPVTEYSFSAQFRDLLRR